MDKKSDKKLDAPASPPPDQVVLDDADVYRILYMQEKGKRLDAERAQYQSENALLVGGLSQKYQVDLSGYAIDLDTKTAKRKP
jgi:hypothetical protein